MPIFNPSCASCKNYLGAFKCQAFPNGIPKAIKEGADPHSKPTSGQVNDVIYEAVEGAEE